MSYYLDVALVATFYLILGAFFEKRKYLIISHLINGKFGQFYLLFIVIFLLIY